MIKFEQYLLECGYKKYKIEKIGKYLYFKETNDHTLSTMVNLDHRYFHYTDPITSKIDNNVSLEQLSRDDRKNEIIVGISLCLIPTIEYPNLNIKVVNSNGEQLYPKLEIIDNKLIYIMYYPNPIEYIHRAMQKFSNEEILESIKTNKELIINENY